MLATPLLAHRTDASRNANLYGHAIEFLDRTRPSRCQRDCVNAGSHDGHDGSPHHGGRTDVALPLRSCATALLVLLSAATWTVTIASNGFPRFICFPSSRPGHHVRRRTFVPKFVRHETHVRIDVLEEELVPRAKIIQSRFAVRRPKEAMFRALPVAGEPHFAVSAVTR